MDTGCLKTPASRLSALCAQSLSHVWLLAAPWSPPGSSVHGIFQARILEWVAISSSREFPKPRDQTRISCVSCIAGRFFTTVPPGKPNCFTCVSLINSHNNPKRWDQELRRGMAVTQLVQVELGSTPRHVPYCADSQKRGPDAGRSEAEAKSETRSRTLELEVTSDPVLLSLTLLFSETGFFPP